MLGRETEAGALSSKLGQPRGPHAGFRFPGYPGHSALGPGAVRLHAGPGWLLWRHVLLIGMVSDLGSAGSAGGHFSLGSREENSGEK